jgi:tetratricopeptide (TPR) repeat protein
MDGRISAWLMIPLTMLGAGCVTTQTQKNVTPPGNSNLTRIDDTPRPKKDDAPKRNPQPSTEIAFGKMKEGEADSEAAKTNPEAQARLRDEARQAYQHALKLDPNHLEAQRCLGRLYAKMGDFARAQEVYKKAMATHPKDASLWYDLGLCHNRRKEFRESMRCFSKALELEPENRDYLKKLGFTLAWIGQVDQGLTYLTRAQGAAQAHLNIAYVLDQKDQRELAKQHCQLALRENSQLQEARELLARLEGPAANAGLRGSLLSPVALE